MNTWQIIGLAAAALAFLCALGIACWYLFAPTGQHAKRHNKPTEPEVPEHEGWEGKHAATLRLMVVDHERARRDRLGGS